MKTVILAALAATSLQFSASPVRAQPAPVACPVTSMSLPSTLTFYQGLDISPSDTPLDAWCKLQRLKGDFKFNVLFGPDPALVERQQKGAFMGDMFKSAPGISPNKTFDVRFDGQPVYGQADFAMMLQSLLPQKKRETSDPMQKAFGEVLGKVVELRAPKTPDGQSLSLSVKAPMAKELVLWEELALRIKPIRYAGTDFKLSIYFKPTVGQLFAGLDGAAPLMTLHGEKSDVMRLHGDAEGSCSEFVPDCVGRPDLVPLLTAWQFDRMVLESDEGQLSSTAQVLLGEIAAAGKKYVKRNTMKQFTLSEGKGEVKLDDGSREIWARAYPRNGKTGGTARIAVRYQERENAKLTYRRALENHVKTFRDKVYVAYEAVAPVKASVTPN